MMLAFLERRESGDRMTNRIILETRIHLSQQWVGSKAWWVGDRLKENFRSSGQIQVSASKGFCEKGLPHKEAGLVHL